MPTQIILIGWTNRYWLHQQLWDVTHGKVKGRHIEKRRAKKESFLFWYNLHPSHQAGHSRRVNWLKSRPCQRRDCSFLLLFLVEQLPFSDLNYSNPELPSSDVLSLLPPTPSFDQLKQLPFRMVYPWQQSIPLTYKPLRLVFGSTPVLGLKPMPHLVQLISSNISHSKYYSLQSTYWYLGHY